MRSVTIVVHIACIKIGIIYPTFSNYPTTTEEMVEYAYSTVEADEVVKNNLKISNETSVTNFQNLNKSSENYWMIIYLI